MKPLIGKIYLFLPTTKDVWDTTRKTYSDIEKFSNFWNQNPIAANEEGEQRCHILLYGDGNTMTRAGFELQRGMTMCRWQCSIQATRKREGLQISWEA